MVFEEMSKLVKKVGNKKFYEIEGIRAGGIIPYYIKNIKNNLENLNCGVALPR